jgi:hypothetical protein
MQCARDRRLLAVSRRLGATSLSGGTGKGASTSPRTRSYAPYDTGYEDNAENDPDDRVKWSISAVAPWVHRFPPHDQLSSGPAATAVTFTCAPDYKPE